MLTQIIDSLEENQKTELPQDFDTKQSKYTTTSVAVNLPNFDPYIEFCKLTPKRRKRADSQLVAFFNSYDYLSTKDENKSTIMVIPVRSHSLTCIFGYYSQVQKNLKIYQKIGLLEIVSAKKRFGCKDKSKNLAYTYRYNHKVAKFLKEKLVNTEPFYYSGKPKEDFSIKEYYTKYNPDIGYNKIPLISTETKTDSTLKTIIEEKNPLIEKTRDIIKDLNKNFYFDKPEFKTKYEINLHKTDKTFTKAGIRATSEFCNSCKEESEVFEKYNHLLRKDILKKYGIPVSNYNDVNASVPRVNLSLHAGKWVTRDELNDLYFTILEECKNQINERLCNCKSAIENKLPNYKSLYYRKKLLEKFSKSIENDSRNTIKSLFMRGYFCRSLDDMVAKISCASKNSPKKLEKPILKLSCEILFDSIRAVIGESLGSKIFIYESAIMNLAAKKLCERNNFCSIVYDGFYTRKYLSDYEFENLLSESFNDLKSYFVIDSANAESAYEANASPAFCSNCGCINSIYNGICIECNSSFNSNTNSKNKLENFRNITEAALNNFKNVTESKKLDRLVFNNILSTPHISYNILSSLCIKLENPKEFEKFSEFLNEKIVEYVKLE